MADLAIRFSDALNATVPIQTVVIMGPQGDKGDPGTTDYNELENKPDLATVATSGDYNDLANLPSLFGGSWDNLTDKPTLFDGSWGSLSGKPTFSAVALSGSYEDLEDLPSLFSGSWDDLTDKPSLFSGSWNDLSDKPTLFSGSYDDLADKPALATVATSGSYNDLTDKPAASTAAETGRNRIINGAMQVWQRGTTFTPPTVTVTYLVDRFFIWCEGASPTVTKAYGAGPNGVICNSLKITGASGNTSVRIAQRIESIEIDDLVETEVTYSAWVYSDDAFTPDLSGQYPSVADDWGVSNTVITGMPTFSLVPAATWTRIEGTFTVPSEAVNGLQAELGLGAIPDGVNRYLTMVQLEAGTSATTFERVPYPQVERACMRYYFADPTYIRGWARNAGDAARYGAWYYPPMRVSPICTVDAYNESTGVTSAPSGWNAHGPTHALAETIPGDTTTNISFTNFVANAEL